MSRSPGRVVAAVLLSLLPLAACTGPKAEPVHHVIATPGRAEILVERLEPGIWRVIDTAYASAVSAAVETPGGLVLVDTPWTPAATEAAVSELERRTGRRAELLLITHFHLDRCGGASVLEARGVPIAAGKETVELLKRRFAAEREDLLATATRNGEPKTPAGAQWKAFAAEVAAIRPFRVDRVLEGKRPRLTASGVPVELVFPGRGHTPDNRVAWFPEQKFLFAGCLVRDGSLGPTEDAAPRAEWHDTVESLYTYDATIVLPGHGLRRSPNLILDTMEMLKLVDELPLR